MATRIIDGKATADDVRVEVATAVAAFTHSTGTTPGLATILVGDDPASEVYVRNKRRAASAAGIADLHVHLPGDAAQDEVIRVVDKLAADPAVSGILVQLPLPDGLDAAAIIDRIPWQKDVDGLTTTSAGLLARDQIGLRPCTPSGVLTLLDAHEIPLAGAEVVVVGRSELVGRPLAQLMLHRHSTVTTVHSRTRNSSDVMRRADILVVAAGIPGLIGREHVKKGATVIDVGIHRVGGRLRGDVRFDELLGHASHLTPVPGGVGPMTIAELLRNTLRAAEIQRA
ncbi:bifunctional 5,10-methylenetetrahydrofolate dehydrogenase/5,10-methenyltetrahydrofolate cyclohydrolase [Diaminobutyricibacter sp. McL0618]|uniref:bifunctional 5,10-methylenetetrahydrofolate dehydrogenase/5,10-methenyltetrahydrofolate cyclohydrolase n=1 Tax=Leifsonia sp. McL0618 TaxID=3415677 RepID=UPI003CF359FB